VAFALEVVGRATDAVHGVEKEARNKNVEEVHIAHPAVSDLNDGGNAASTVRQIESRSAPRTTSFPRLFQYSRRIS
jgi:hypothetical protein